MHRRPLAVGLGLGGLYAIVAVATLLLADRPLLPLFDGLAPPPPYRWVTPPPEVASGNQQPTSAEREAQLGPEGSPFLSVTPEDGQAIVVMDDGAVPPNPPDAPNPPATTVRVGLTPHDPGTLADLPDGLTAASNAYRVVITYQPSGTAVSMLRPNPITSVNLTSAGFSDVMLYSADGGSWARQSDAEPRPDGHGLGTPFSSPGYFLVASIDRAPGGTNPAVYVLLLGLPVVVVMALVAVKRRNDEARANARAKAKADARKRGGRGPAGPPSKRRPPPPGRSGRRSE
jgi:hypothetical protein